MATLTTTPIKVFVSGETVTPTKLNELSQSTVALTAGSIVDADVSASAGIAASKLATATQQSLVPAGAVMPFAMNSVPLGWLPCDGSPVSRSIYAGLFAVVGELYGVGDTSTTFNVPDLRGYFVRGSGTNSDGTVAGAFGGKQADGIKAHTHTTTGNAGVFLQSPGSFVYGVASGSENTGSTGGAETRPKNIALLYCIKF